MNADGLRGMLGLCRRAGKMQTGADQVTVSWSPLYPADQVCLWSMPKEGGEWTLAPAYDLTGSEFPSEDPWSAHGGCHQLSVNGKQSKITDDDLLVVADRFAIGTAPRVLDEVKAALA